MRASSCSDPTASELRHGFLQFGTSHRIGRVSATTDIFLIDRSAEQVYLADDGTFEFMGPSRAYGVEAKLGIDVNRSSRSTAA